MNPYPPIYPEMFDNRRPSRPSRPEHDCWNLSPTDVTATVLGVDSCGGIIVRIQRQACFCQESPSRRPSHRPEPPCKPHRPCNCR